MTIKEFEIYDATQSTSDALRRSMQDAFSDYAVPLQMSADAFDLMMQQRGLDRTRSRIAVIDDDIAALWLVSVRGDAAYLISSGTRPQYRSQGLARALAMSCIEGLRSANVRSFQTEVLRSNDTAKSLYVSLGLRQRRVLDCYTVPAGERTYESRMHVTQAPWSEVQNTVAPLRDWIPSWQNSDASVAAIEAGTICYIVQDKSALLGYVVVGNQSGNIHQIAVRHDQRRRGIGAALVQAAQRDHPDLALRFINIQADDRGFRAFMSAQGAEEIPGQFELAMPL